MNGGAEREQLLCSSLVSLPHDRDPPDQFVPGEIRDRVPLPEPCPFRPFNGGRDRQQEKLPLHPRSLFTVKDPGKDEVPAHLLPPAPGNPYRPLLLLHLCSVTLMYTGNAQV